MKFKIIFSLLFLLGISNSFATQFLADDENKEVQDLKAEIESLKAENEKLKKDAGLKLKTNKEDVADQSLKLRIRNKVIRPLGKDWYITVSGGYGIPFITTNKKSPLKEIGEGDWQQSPGALSRKPLFGTNGGGFAFNISAGHMFNKNIGVDLMYTAAWHPESLNSRINTVGSPLMLGSLNLGTPSYYATQKTSTFAMYISPHLVMKWDNGKRFGITGRAGLVMPIFGNTVSRASIDDKSGRLLQTLNGIPPILGIPLIHMTLNAKAKTSYQPTVGVSTSIGFDVKLSDRVWLYAEARIQAYTIKLIKIVMTEFQMKTNLKLGDIEIPTSIADDLIKDISGGLLSLASLTGGLPLNINSAEEAPIFLTQYNYVDEITEESNTARYGTKSLIGGPLNFTGLEAVDLNKPMDEPGQKFNISTLYFNLGMKVDFDLWDKKRKEKAIKRQGL